MGWVYTGSWFFIGSYVILGFGGYFRVLFGTQPIVGAFLLIAGITLINLTGGHLFGRVQNVIVLLAVGTLVIYSIVSLYGVATGLHGAGISRFSPLLPNGFSGVLEAAPLVFLALSGFDMVAAAGEEVEKPQRTLPLAILLTLAIVLLLYLLVTAATAGVLSPPELVSGTSSPLADAAGQLFGRTGQQLIAGAAMLTTAATGNAVLLATSRITFAMARDRLLPRGFAHVHPSTKIPWVAILTSGVMLALLVLTATVLADAIPLLASVGSFLYVLQFVFPLAALVVLRRRSRVVPSFRTPAPYLVLPLAFGVCLLLLYESRQAAIGIGLGWLMAGLVAYLVAQSLILTVRRKRYIEKGYTATMEEIATLKQQISGMLNEPQALFEQLLATQARIAELKWLRAIQARIEELEQHRGAQGRIQELKHLRTTQAGIEELELRRTMQARIENIKLMRTTQACIEESNFLRTIQVQPRERDSISVLETALHRVSGESDVLQEATISSKTDEPDLDITDKRKTIN